MPAKNPRRSDSYVPPPWGPVIWYEYKCHNSSACENHNKGLIADYIFDTRYEELKKSNEPLSEMELKELIGLGKELRSLYDGENLQMVDDILKEYKGWLKNPPRELVKDSMSKNIEILDKYWVIHKDRHKVRRSLCLLRNGLNTLLLSIKSEATKSNPDLTWKKDELDTKLKLNKKFIDRVIKEKLFTREDIYGKIFDDDTIFDQIREAHKVYAAKWKQHYGTNP